MKILFCSDGSSQSENAVRFGALIAAACRAETSILGITEKEGDEDTLLLSLRQAQDILKEQRLYAELITKAGRPLHEIVKRTREKAYNLVVIGAVRKTVRHPLWESADPLWMSELAYKIIESIEAPVLVVIGERPALKRILLCTGGPAVRIRGDLGAYSEPNTAELEYQDWFTPWERLPTDSADEEILLTYARSFYFGG